MFLTSGLLGEGEHPEARKLIFYKGTDKKSLNKMFDDGDWKSLRRMQRVLADQKSAFGLRVSEKRASGKP